ncbi:glycosyltransferase family 4 protein [Pedobacter sp. BS3]|uniref:glycosyltransferase n=1 Tax=Pedobacter sp. BS3 TaxID=2567937 RepID=UPI0011EDEAA8|nr:glycosyltransferase [Pedobacter sp. BS3]TZF83634.1 glycosyltransferase family 4 protein [Pedobacter sp. BS3]
MNKDYVLVLPSWYPSRVHRFNGDFNERLVNATSKYIKQIVLYVIKDATIKETQIEVEEDDKIITYIIYYPAKGNSIISKFFLFCRYAYISIKYTNIIIRKFGLPKLIHCYVIFPAGIMAKFVKWRYKIPIILTEHWSAYYPEAKDSFMRSSILKRLLIRNLLKSVNHIIPVAHKLGYFIKQWAPGIPQTVIPNVVDTSSFNYSYENRGKTFKFLHISSMYYAKNVEGLLRVFENIAIERDNVELSLIGYMPDHIRHIINGSRVLQSVIDYKGEIAYNQVSHYMKEHDCLVMFSRYESLPCVILEALCCGLPVIATDVGGIREVISQYNGILIKSECETALNEAIGAMIDNIDTYNREEISKEAIKKFNYNNVTRSICEIYKKVIKLSC